MSDDNKRPNAAYKLSEKKQPDEELVFRYSREERLAKAPKAVRDLYDVKKKPKFSLLGPLIGGNGRSVLFGSILIVCGALLILSIFNPMGGYTLDGNHIEIQAIKYEGAIIVVIKKTVKPNNQSAYTGMVNIGISEKRETEEQESGEIFLHRLFFTGEKSEDYRFTIPFDSEEILMVLQTEKQSLNLKLKVN